MMAHKFRVLYAASRSSRFQQVTAVRHASIFSPMDWWRTRQEKKEEEKYRQKIKEMSEKEEWTIGEMKQDISEALNTWSAKFASTLGESKETKQAKDMHKTVTGIAKVMGDNASYDLLEAMTRTDKLKAAVEGQTTVEEINSLIQQFQTMNTVHKVVRQRKLEGKKIPETAEAIQTLIQTEGPKVLSKTQRQRMGEKAAKMLRRTSGRR